MRQGLPWHHAAGRAGLAMLPALLCVVACVPAASTGERSATAGMGQRLLQEYIQPRTRELHAAAGTLHARLHQYCRAPASNGLREQVEAQLGATVEAWARVELLRFGPLVAQNRGDNFFFWPDPRGIVQRQVRTLLAAADPTVLEPARFVQQSAAVQGLPGLEYALFADGGAHTIGGGGAGDGGAYRCAYALAAARNLARLARGIVDEWQAGAPLARQLARPAPDHSVYRSDAEVATEALKALSTALHAARDQKLAPALGETASEARGELLPLHRSGLTNRYLAALVRGWIDFVEVAHFGQRLAPAEHWIDENLRAELQRMLADLEALQTPARQAVAEPEQRDLLLHVTLLLTNARALVDEYLAPALGVNRGFNSLDGD